MANEERPAKRAKLDFNDHVRVLVGPSKKEFVVHKDIVTRRSPFFKAATSARWNGTKPIELPDDKPKVFAEYLHCLYVGDLAFGSETVRASAGELEGALDFYIFANKMEDVKATNDAIDAIIKWSDNKHVIPPLKHVGYAYERTLDGSRLRRLLVDYYIQECVPAVFDRVPDADLTEFYRDVFKEYLRRKREAVDALKTRDTETIEDAAKPESKPPPTISKVFNRMISWGSPCYYHAHDDSCLPCTSA
ncbi:hypothetical protein LTR97_004723 [Elasticomyces elasticus]|uniref:BTB domain-containing protein n=1 Tax=Elasticomyces elasticus TaxID=574655 RepID=A0AAN7WM07_9PEZI|nr:hypothetical protein LTR97_004723 [Elasticomyces elasticus]